MMEGTLSATATTTSTNKREQRHSIGSLADTEDSLGKTSQSQKKGFKGTAENAKTKLCMRWLGGDCRFGPRCNFAHGEHELRKLPPKTAGRYSQDMREKDRDRNPYNYGRSSFDGVFRAFPGMYEDYYRASAFSYMPNGMNYNGSAQVLPHQNQNHPGQQQQQSSPTHSGYATGGAPSPPMSHASIHMSSSPAPILPRDVYSTTQAFAMPGPNGWMMYKDPESGEFYYHNHHSQATQWNCPEEWVMP